MTNRITSLLIVEFSARQSDMKFARRNILWIDCLGGIVVGVLMLLACRWLAQWDGLPVGVIVATGCVNLGYGCFSLFVTTRQSRSISLVQSLAAANMGWLLVCIGITAANWPQISFFGIIHVMGEGLYVAALGYTEWIWRQSLSDS